MFTTVLAGALALLSAPAPDSSARAVLDTAIARLGGLPALSAVERIELQVMTEWQRTTFDARPAPTVLSYELSTELRDYTAPAWRYSRRFFTPTGPIDVIDVITDSVAAMWMKGQWRAQNVAYLAEREEAFTFAPERVVRLAREAADAHALPDTIISGVRYARISATVGRFHPTLHFRRGDGLLALARFRAAQPDDFGLAPWGAMDVAIWYTSWRMVGESGLALPMQLDVWRIGRPYKRMTTLTAKVNPVIPADSFAITDSLRASFLATARRPMFDLPMDSARIADGDFATFGAPGTPAGAVKVGGRWLLIEGGTAPLTVERSVAYLRRSDPRVALGGALVTAAGGAGGVAWLARQGAPFWVAGSARAYADAALTGAEVRGAKLEAVTNDRWIRLGSDSLRVEMVDLPDYPGTPVVYVPSLRWAYAWPAAPVQVELVKAYIRGRGWRVDRVGNGRNLVGVGLAGAASGF
jgi:hypothetical protein